MREPIYNARATVTGGRQQGHGRSSDGELDVQLRLPGELGGKGAARIRSSCSPSDSRRVSRARWG
jgi:organic hydroperoxide reductase OsmC/OhrA